jgi:sarcosine oxidase delta subunit
MKTAVVMAFVLISGTAGVNSAWARRSDDEHKEYFQHYNQHCQDMQKRGKHARGCGKHFKPQVPKAPIS